MVSIDTKTSIPLMWLISGMVATFGVASAGTMWVFSVNERLTRIEERLGTLPIAKIESKPKTGGKYD